ncbi:MAG: hypothetical protein AAB817_01875 [Patescibacteria group bacterium]
MFLLAFYGTQIAGAITQYPPGSLLQPNDVTSSHIRDATIVDADVSSTAKIGASKVSPNGTTGTVLLTDGTNVATTTGLSFATSTADLYVFSGRVHATSTNFNSVNYTWPSADGTNGQVLQTNGSGTLSFTAAASSLVTTNLTAGTAITAGEVLMIATSSTATTTIYGDTEIPAGVSVGVATNDSEKVGQSFAETAIIDTVRIFAKKVGSPTDNLTCGLQADSAGVPSGTFLDSGTTAASGISTSMQAVYFVFATPIKTLSTATNWVVCERSGALDGTNIININASNVTTYAGGAAYKKNASWTVVTGWDMSIQLGEPIVLGRVYPASATTNRYSGDYVGVAGATAAKAASVAVNLLGISLANVGMTTGNSIYLSNTFGATSTAAGVNSVLLGKALGASSLYLK